MPFIGLNLDSLGENASGLNRNPICTIFATIPATTTANIKGSIIDNAFFKIIIDNVLAVAIS